MSARTDAAGDLRIGREVVIPARELTVRFVRASGPGGQNVNKVASKAVLRFRVSDSPSLPEPVRARAVARLAGRLTNAGDLVLTCAVHREQARNRATVLARLAALLAPALHAPKRRKPTRLSAAARARRVEEKRARGARKRERGNIDD